MLNFHVHFSATAVPRVPQSVGPAGSLSKQPHTDSAYVEEGNTFAMYYKETLLYYS